MARSATVHLVIGALSGGLLMGSLLLSPTSALANPACIDLFQTAEQRAELMAIRLVETVSNPSSFHIDRDALESFISEAGRSVDSVGAFLQDHQNYPLLGLERSQVLGDRHERFARDLERLEKLVAPKRGIKERISILFNGGIKGVERKAQSLQADHHTLRQEVELLKNEQGELRKVRITIAEKRAEILREMDSLDAVINQVEKSTEAMPPGSKERQRAEVEVLARLVRLSDDMGTLYTVLNGLDQSVDQRIAANGLVIDGIRSLSGVTTSLVTLNSRIRELRLNPSSRISSQAATPFDRRMLIDLNERIRGMGERRKEWALKRFVRQHATGMSVEDIQAVIKLSPTYGQTRRETQHDLAVAFLEVSASRLTFDEFFNLAANTDGVGTLGVMRFIKFVPHTNEQLLSLVRRVSNVLWVTREKAHVLDELIMDLDPLTASKTVGLMFAGDDRSYKEKDHYSRRLAKKYFNAHQEEFANPPEERILDYLDAAGTMKEEALKLWMDRQGKSLSVDTLKRIALPDGSHRWLGDWYSAIAFKHYLSLHRNTMPIAEAMKLFASFEVEKRSWGTEYSLVGYEKVKLQTKYSSSGVHPCPLNVRDEVMAFVRARADSLSIEQLAELSKLLADEGDKHIVMNAK